MAESIGYTIQIYFMTFCIGMVIAAMIKGMLMVLRRFTPKNEVADE